MCGIAGFVDAARFETDTAVPARLDAEFGLVHRMGDVHVRVDGRCLIVKPGDELVLRHAS